LAASRGILLWVFDVENMSLLAVYLAAFFSCLIPMMLLLDEIASQTPVSSVAVLGSWFLTSYLSWWPL
jgi:hypothetical protein